jgi:hypothetical protein
MLNFAKTKSVRHLRNFYANLKIGLVIVLPANMLVCFLGIFKRTAVSFFEALLTNKKWQNLTKSGNN